MANRRGLSLSKTKGRRRVSKKPRFVAEVAIRPRSESGEGEIVGTAKIEKLPGGALIAHIDMAGKSADILRRGFSLGTVTMTEIEEGDETS